MLIGGLACLAIPETKNEITVYMSTVRVKVCGPFRILLYKKVIRIPVNIPVIPFINNILP